MNDLKKEQELLPIKDNMLFKQETWLVLLIGTNLCTTSLKALKVTLPINNFSSRLEFVAELRSVVVYFSNKRFVLTS